MFGRNHGSKPQSKIDSLIGAGTRIEGNVTFTGGLRVDGEVKGNVCAEKGAGSTLMISVSMMSPHRRSIDRPPGRPAWA